MKDGKPFNTDSFYFKQLVVKAYISAIFPQLNRLISEIVKCTYIIARNKLADVLGNPVNKRALTLPSPAI